MLKYNFESNSQLLEYLTNKLCVGNYMLKYNFESNSQLSFWAAICNISWELYAKVQFWKQFTTADAVRRVNEKLGIIC